MILIADSGSTKTDWRLVADKKEILSCQTIGLNPYFVHQEMVINALKTSPLIEFVDKVKAIYFYGAGCSSPAKQLELSSYLASFFSAAKINVDHDLLGAARALCKTSGGMVAILGTGANTCLYDGKQITHNIPALGYVLGDEGGGVSLGKLLIKMVLHKKLSSSLLGEFEKSFPDLTINIILDKVYQQPLPNRFLASFSPFIAQHKSHSEIKQLINSCFHQFFSEYIVFYPNYKNYPLHLVGSIAYHFKNEISEVANKYDVKIGDVLQQPIDELVEFHIRYE